MNGSPSSLRTALLISILSGLLVVLTVAGGAVFFVARTSFRTHIDDALVVRANTFASMVTQDRDGLDFDYDGPLTFEELGILIRITDDEGEIIAVSPDWPGMEGYEPDDEPDTDDEDDDEPEEPDEPGADRYVTQRGPTLDWHATTITDTETPDDKDARLVRVVRGANWDAEELGPLDPAVQLPRDITVEVIGDLGAAERAESALLTALIAGGFVAAAGTGLAVWLGIGRGLAPIRRLGHELDRIDSGDLSVVPDPRSYPQELRPMVASIDSMLERVGAAMQREQRFTDAAAHELRTPIAELRTITDVARRWPDERRLRRSIDAAGDVADEMETLLDALLSAARGSGTDDSKDARVPLLPLIRAVADANSARLSERDVRCEIDGDEQAYWTGPRGAILAIIRNLIENAGEYTPTGGAVRIRTIADTSGTGFEIENGPVHIDPEQIDRLFEPFWRADTARADRKHRGLGLSIVDALASSLGLSRDATLTGDSYLRIGLRARTIG